jgi:uracil DNA glycosylase
MQELVESPVWDQLYAFLKAESQKGKVLIPKSSDTWKSLQLCDRTKVKAIVLLQCPYATQREKVTISNGVPMDCSNIAPHQQPSLSAWWDAIEQQYGFHPDNDLRCDISYLLREEHVLLLNTSLTVELNKVDSHQTQWHDVMKWFIENVINKYLNGIPIVMCGTQAQRFEKYLNPLANPLLKVEHPAAASYANRNWKHQDMHLWINKIIEGTNGRDHTVRWLRNKSDNQPVPKEVKEWIEGTVKAQDRKDLPWE